MEEHNFQSLNCICTQVSHDRAILEHVALIFELWISHGQFPAAIKISWNILFTTRPSGFLSVNEKG